jgi:hypothetical protein
MPANGSRTVQIAIPSDGSAPPFPDRCVCCGAPKEAASNLALSRNVMVGKGKRQKQVQKSVKWAVPHCRRCASSTKSVFLAGCIPFGLGFVLLGLAAFLAVTGFAWWYGFDEMGRPNNNNSLVLGAFFGLLAGLLGGFLFELLARLVLLPFYGRALLGAPLLAKQLLDDSDHIAGLTAKMSADGTQMQLSFANASIAGEFEALNAAAIGRQ